MCFVLISEQAAIFSPISLKDWFSQPR